ncbi:unnamed protein product [marine sediment metagenome]|uniref:Uncharacterized protein n=1 Tax=marine sediment metagenome TaxID=412755 RepID=X1KCR6_9ZZZZ
MSELKLKLKLKYKNKKTKKVKEELKEIKPLNLIDVYMVMSLNIGVYSPLCLLHKSRIVIIRYDI